MNENNLPIGMSMENYKTSANKMAENKDMENKSTDTSKECYVSYYSGISALPKDPVVAMAYVPFQLDTTAYDTEDAFRNGTLFKVLDKPFLGYLNSQK